MQKDESAPQGKSFTFDKENQIKAREIISKYPEGRQKSAVMGLLYLAQKQNLGWISPEAISHIAQLLLLPPSKVLEVASFYTMFNLQKVGRYLIQVCGTTPCMLRNAKGVLATFEKELNIKVGQTTPDTLFTLMEVECLGACANAPVVQINDYYYEDLSEDAVRAILNKLKSGAELAPHSARGRVSAEPILPAEKLVSIK